jgi:hypothetical protein
MTFTNDGTQTSVPLEYRDPPVEYITNNGNIQLWKVTHNGVDTHAIHTHLFDMQLVNRVAWDGTIRPPDPNELGWKETIRMNPLEDIIVALRPVTPPTPFASQIPNSVRLWDPTMMTGMTWSSFDPNTGAAVTWTNSPQTFGWEYVWHCHLLGHEENDMMRPISFNLQSTPPILNGTPVVVGTDVTFSLSPPVGTTPVSYEVTYTGSTGALQSFTYTGNPQSITISDCPTDRPIPLLWWLSTRQGKEQACRSYSRYLCKESKEATLGLSDYNALRDSKRFLRALLFFAQIKRELLRFNSVIARNRKNLGIQPDKVAPL